MPSSRGSNTSNSTDRNANTLSVGRFSNFRLELPIILGLLTISYAMGVFCTDVNNRLDKTKEHVSRLEERHIDDMNKFMSVIEQQNKTILEHSLEIAALRRQEKEN